MSTYKLTNYEGFQGHDSWCYRANIRRNGKLIGEVHDPGMGGEAIFHFAQGVEQQDSITQEVGDFVTECARKEWQDDDELKEFWKTEEEYAQSCTNIWDYLAHQLIDRIEDVKQAKRMKPNDGETVWLVIGNGENITVRGKSMLYVTSSNLTDGQAIGIASREVKHFPDGIKSMRKLHREKELTINR